MLRTRSMTIVSLLLSPAFLQISGRPDTFVYGYVVKLPNASSKCHALSLPTKGCTASTASQNTRSISDGIHHHHDLCLDLCFANSPLICRHSKELAITVSEIELRMTFDQRASRIIMQEAEQPEVDSRSV